MSDWRWEKWENTGYGCWGQRASAPGPPPLPGPPHEPQGNGQGAAMPPPEPEPPGQPPEPREGPPRPKAVPEQGPRRAQDEDVIRFMKSIHAAEMEALKANQELAFDTERRALQATAESDKAAALAFANDSWQARLEQETGKVQQLQKKTRDDMEAFYQNELKVQLDKQRVRLQLQLQLQLRMEEFYDNQSKEEEDKRQKELVKLRAEASDLKASKEFWKNSVNEWKEKLQDPWADSVWIVLSELPCVIRADQDLDLQKRAE